MGSVKYYIIFLDSLTLKENKVLQLKNLIKGLVSVILIH